MSEKRHLDCRDDIQIKLYRNPARRGIALDLLVDGGRDVFWRADEITLHQSSLYEEDFRVPLMTLSDNTCQHLMDQLYHAGFRPTDSQPTDSMINAMQAHLADMRKIVSKNIKVDL